MEKFRSFILNNHSLVKEYYDCYYKRYKENNWKEKLRILFVNALSSGRDGKVSEKSKTIQEFEIMVNTMNSPHYKELLNRFHCTNYYDLFESFKKFDQVGPKKSALFLRDILFFDNVIKYTPINLKKELLVPVDRVIVRTMNSIFSENYNPDRIKTFNEINNRAKVIFPEQPIYLEDLWFWGRFYRCKENESSSIPFCEFNKDLLIIDINVTKRYREKLLKFSYKNKKCPFKNICSHYFNGKLYTAS